MKIHSLIALFLICSSLTLNAQNKTKQLPRFNVSAGVGLVPTFVSEGASTKLPPLSLQAGYQINPNFSLSGFAGYAEANSRPGLISDGKQIYTNNIQFTAALRGEWKKPVHEKLEVYGGGMLGLSHSRIREYDAATGQEFIRQPNSPTKFDPNAKARKLFYSGFLGGRYFFRKNIGLFLEAGFGVSLLNTGIAVKI